MDQDGYKKLISGKKKGLGASLSRGFLRILSFLYALIIALRNWAYSTGKLKIHKAGVPVISIGNLTTGGTGKTPLVIWVCNLLQKKQTPCAILTRGYKTEKGKFSDEPAVLSKSCPHAKIVMNPNRLEGAELAIEKYSAKALVMDDGFQHRRLGRDLDIVTVDAICPFGYGKMLPAGLLREPISQIKRAQALVITRCDLATEEKIDLIQQKIKKYNPDIAIAKTAHTPVRAKGTKNIEFELNDLEGKKVFAFCGIGNPQAFFDTIKSLNVNLIGKKTFNDHHPYSADDITDIYEEALYCQAELILTTLKDWTKTTALAEMERKMDFAWLDVELRFISGAEKITQLIEKTLQGKIPDSQKEID